MKRTLITGAALAAGLAVAIPALAQQGGPGGFHRMHGWGGGPGGGMARMCTDTEAHMAGMLAFAEAKLKITEQQRPSWNALVQQVRSLTPTIQQACTTMQAARQADQPPALTERLSRMEAMMTTGLDALKRVKPALDTLYGELTPEQKKIADTMVPGGPMRGGPAGKRGWGGPGPQNAPTPQAPQ